MDLNFKLFNGASIQFHDQERANESASRVAAMPAVKQIWPVRRYHLPDHEVLWTGEASPDDEITKRAAADTFSPHVMTQVNQLRDKGVTGEGIKIAVVDTGVSSEPSRRAAATGPCQGQILGELSS